MELGWGWAGALTLCLYCGNCLGWGLNPVLRRLQESTLAMKFIIALCCPWNEGEMSEFRGKREREREQSRKVKVRGVIFS